MEADCSNSDISWNWISSDECIKKKILQNGWWNGSRPLECSPCIIRIDTSGYDDFTIDAYNRMSSIDQHKLVIGDGDTEFDRMLDRLLPTMDASEECLVEYKIGDKLYHVKITLIQYGPGLLRYQLTAEEKFQKAIECKERGVKLFNEGRINDALFRFKKSAQLLIFLNRDLEQYQNIFLKICNNLAQCYLQLGNNEYVIELSKKILDKDSKNVKCLLRRAAAFEALKDFVNALDVYKRIIQLESNNRRALDRLLIVSKHVDDMNFRYNETVKRMFQF